MTETGTSIGTPHYMAPEQATGDRQITGRADIYSLGSVLYEMLAGEPPHTGASAQAVIMKIIAEPVKPVTALRKSVPPNVAAAVAQALEKLPADRFESAKAFADALVDPHFTGAAASGASAWTDRPGRGALLAGATLAVLVLLAALWGWQRSQAASAGPALALALDVGLPGVDPFFFDISPAGDAFVLGTASGIAVRVPGQRTFRVLEGTRGGSQPVFSPTGDTILFSLAGRLRRIAVAGGRPLTVLSTNTVFAAYPQWGEDGTIAFLGGDGIRLIEPGTAGSRLLTGSRSGRPTAVLPDGSGVLYAETDEGMQLRLFDLAADSSILLLDDAGVAEYVGTGHIIVARQARGLFALPFDLDRRVPTGPPVAVLPDAVADALNKSFAVSASGTLMYVEVPDIEETLVRVGAGGGLDTLRQPAQRLAYVRYSPDGRTLAIAAGSGRIAERHIGLFDLAAGSYTQWTFEGGAHGPVWSPDGRWIAYSAELPGSVAEDVYIQPLDGSTPARRVTSLPSDQHANAWPTANALLFADAGDIRMVDPFATDPTPTDWLATQQARGTIAVSPDGQLAAYVADVAGDPHVFVRRFPDAGVQTRVSRDPGFEPRWSADSRRLLYLSDADDATVLAARLQREPRLTVLGIDTVVRLPKPTRAWDLDPVSDDLVASQGDVRQRGYVVVVNWLDALRGLRR